MFIKKPHSPSYGYKIGCRCSACAQWKRNNTAAENIQRKRARERKWVLEHPEQHKAHQLAWRKKQGRAPCKHCGTPILYGQPGVQYCRECVGRAKILRDKQRTRRIRNEFGVFKTSRGCSMCGYDRCAAALDFHHLDSTTKERRVTATQWKTGVGAIELQKCILVCKNCHMELHAKLESENANE